jgi:hypothetical protein
MREVTSSLAIDPVWSHYDMSSHAILVDIVLVNTGKKSLHDPLMIIGTNLHSDFGVAVATNAQGTIRGQPAWRANDIVPSNGLASQARSKPLRLVFSVRNFKVAPSPYYANGDGVAMKFRIYGAKKEWFGIR